MRVQLKIDVDPREGGEQFSGAEVKFSPLFDDVDVVELPVTVTGKRRKTHSLQSLEGITDICVREINPNREGMTAFLPLSLFPSAQWLVGYETETWSVSITLTDEEYQLAKAAVEAALAKRLGQAQAEKKHLALRGKMNEEDDNGFLGTMHGDAWSE